MTTPPSEDWVSHRLGKKTYVWTASTLGGNPISTTAARAALSVFRQPGVYERLHGIGAYLRKGMRQVLQARGIAGQIIGEGPPDLLQT